MTREVAFGSQPIVYQLLHSARATFAITVHADRRVVAKAPVGLSPEDADVRVARRGAWILRHWRRADAGDSLNPARRYVSGASHYLFGRELRLRVRKSRVTDVLLDRPYLRVLLPRVAETAVSELVEAWRVEAARARFKARLLVLAPRVLGRTSRLPRMRMVMMRRRWGSCSRKGMISLNPWLSEHPQGCIDYVLLHELCHLKHLNHGPAFHALLARLLPDWKRWKRRLDRLD